MTQENALIGSIVGNIGLIIMGSIFVIGYANAPVKGCDNLTDTTPVNVVEFCKSLWVKVTHLELTPIV